MEKDKDIITVITDSRRPYIITAAAAAVLIAAASFFAGFFIPKPIAAVNMKLSHYEKKNSEYIDASNAYTSAEKEVNELNSRLTEAQEQLDDFNQSRGSLDKITEKNNQLQSQKEQLQNEISAKRAVLDTLNPKAEKSVNSTVTLSSGRYTAGENFVSGGYVIMGTGSIVISSGGKARVNKALKSDGEKFTLNDGDILKIDGNAKLVREE